MDSVDIFYKLLGTATAVYCKGKEYLRGKVFFYTQKKIASREKKTTSERNYIYRGPLMHELQRLPPDYWFTRGL